MQSRYRVTSSIWTQPSCDLFSCKKKNNRNPFETLSLRVYSCLDIRQRSPRQVPYPKCHKYSSVNASIKVDKFFSVRIIFILHFFSLSHKSTISCAGRSLKPRCVYSNWRKWNREWLTSATRSRTPSTSTSCTNSFRYPPRSSVGFDCVCRRISRSTQ